MGSRSLFSAVLLTAFSATLFAQEAASHYHSVACIKVKPEKAGEFRKFALEEGHKFEQALADSGKVSAALLLRSVFPRGTSATCDYAAVSFYPGVPPPPPGPDEIGALLKKAGIAMSAKQYMDAQASLGELVSYSMLQGQARVGAAKKGDYLMANYMKVPDTTEWIAYEKKVWQPIAESMVKDGTMRGWSANVQVLPAGSDLKFQAVTVDIYPSWDAVFAPFGFAERFKQVHPDMEVGTTMEHFQKLRTILSTELFVAEDVVTPAK